MKSPDLGRPSKKRRFEIYPRENPLDSVKEHTWVYPLQEARELTPVLEYSREQSEIAFGAVPTDEEEDVDVATLRYTSLDRAKEKIYNLFMISGEVMYYSDIADRLGLDLELVVQACQQLEEEGRIEEAGKSG